MFIMFYEHWGANLCVNIFFLSFCVITRGGMAESYGRYIFSFLKKLTKCSSEWSYYFPFPPAVNECSSCFTPLPTFGMVSLFHFIHSRGLVSFWL